MVPLPPEPSAVTVTVAVWVRSTMPAVAEMTVVSATVELSEPVTTPFPFVAPPPVSVLPLPVAWSPTDVPLNGLPYASRTVTVIVELPLPWTIVVGRAVTVERTASAGPGFTVTTGCSASAMPPATAVTVWVPAPVELNDPVASPFTSVVAGWVIVLPLPLTASVTATPFSGLPSPSRTVTATVELPPAANAIGDASTEDNDAEMGDAAGFTVTAACWMIATPLMVADTSLISATVERRLPVISPSPPVVPEGWVRVLPLPVEARTTVAPLIGVPLPSRAVTVIVEAGPPAVIGETALTVDWDADTAGIPPVPATSSTARSPAFADLLRDAVTALRFTPHAASSSVFSPDDGSAISVNPAPGLAAGPLVAAPSRPRATLPALPNGARVLPSTVTALPRAVAACPMAPAPLLPLRSTPVHCDTTHSAFETLLAYVMVIGPLPGAALMARNTTRRATGAVTAS